MTPTPPLETLLPPSSVVRLRLNAVCCSVFMLRCKKAYWWRSATEDSRDKKVERTGSKEISGMMLASRATKNSSWTVAGVGRHKVRPVRIMAVSIFVCVQKVCLLSVFLTLCMFICPSQIDVISSSLPMHPCIWIQMHNPFGWKTQHLYTHSYRALFSCWC